MLGKGNTEELKQGIMEYKKIGATWICKKYDCNQEVIKDYNILRNAEKELKKLKKENKTIEDFSKELKNKMMCIYWGRCEYELIIVKENEHIYLRPWVGSKNPEAEQIEVTNDRTFDWKDFAELHIKNQIFKESAKIDIYDQLVYKWDEFVLYCWNFRCKYERKNR